MAFLLFCSLTLVCERIREREICGFGHSELLLQVRLLYHIDKKRFYTLYQTTQLTDFKIGKH